MSEYIETKKLLDELELTHEQADAMWSVLKESNWKVKALSNSGKNWYDLTLPALRSMKQQVYEDGVHIEYSRIMNDL